MERLVKGERLTQIPPNSFSRKFPAIYKTLFDKTPIILLTKCDAGIQVQPSTDEFPPPGDIFLDESDLKYTIDNSGSSESDSWDPPLKKRGVKKKGGTSKKHRKASNPCPICHKIFVSSNGLREHHKLIHTPGQYPCPEPGCPSIFKNQLYLKRHVAEVHHRHQLKCPHCPAEHKNRYNLGKHIRSAHRETKGYSLECGECSMTFGLKRFLDDHMKTSHLNPKPKQLNKHKIKVKCEICGKSMEQRSMQKHLEIHSGSEERFPCTEEGCWKLYSKKRHLEMHTKAKHGQSEAPQPPKVEDSKPQLETPIENDKTHKKFKCSKCPMSFAFYGRLLYHRRSHSKATPFSCSTCNQSFVSANNLSRHQSLVHKDVTFPCPREGCSSVLKSKENLRLHMENVHLREGRTQCQYCGLKFNKPTTLDHHIREEHRDMKNYTFKCPDAGCELKFSSQRYLDMHLKRKRDPSRGIQTEDPKKLKCPKCDKILKKGAFISHMKTHQDERTVFKCKAGSCDKEYLHKPDLLCHLKVIHGIGRKDHSCKTCRRQARKLQSQKESQEQSEELILPDEIGPEKEIQVKEEPAASNDILLEEIHLEIDQKVKSEDPETNPGTKGVDLADPCEFIEIIVKNKPPRVKKVKEKKLKLEPHQKINKWLERGQYPCPICKQAFKTLKYQKTHTKNVHSKLEIPCPEPGCSSTFKNNIYLKIHRDKVHIPKDLTFPCLQCPMIYKRLGILKEHIRTVHRESMGYAFKCEVEDCGKTFRSQVFLDKHMEKGRHGEGKERAPCPTCGLVLIKRNLELHIERFHVKKRPFLCKVRSCLKSFMTKRHLASHTRKSHKKKFKTQREKVEDEEEMEEEVEEMEEEVEEGEEEILGA